MASDVDQTIAATQDLAANLNNFAATWASIKDSKLAREDMYYFYEDQKKLADPAYIMARRIAAGLNPYGDFQSLTTGQPTPVRSSVPQALQNVSNSLSEQANRRIQRAAQRLTLEQLKLEEKKTQNQTIIADAQSRLLASQTTSTDLANLLRSILMPNEVGISSEQLNKMILDNGILGKNFLRFDDLTDAQIAQMVASANASDANANLSAAQVKRINTLLPYEELKLNADATQADFEASISSLVDDIAKSFPQQQQRPIKALAKLIFLILKSK